MKPLYDEDRAHELIAQGVGVDALVKIAAALERQNELLERISLHLADIAGHLPDVDNMGRIYVVPCEN